METERSGCWHRTGRLGKSRADGTDDPKALRRLWIVQGVDWMPERFTVAAAGALGVWCHLLRVEEAAAEWRWFHAAASDVEPAVALFLRSRIPPWLPATS